MDLAQLSHLYLQQQLFFVTGKFLHTAARFVGLYRKNRLNRHQQIRHLWEFEHVFIPNRTPDGQPQRKPTEHPDLMKYRPRLNMELQKPAPPIKVILLRDIEELGDKFDVISVPANFARNKLFPKKKACYASPFDLEYYAQKRTEWLATQTTPKIVIPKDLLSLAKRLANKTIRILVSMTNEWVMKKDILVASLEQEGIHCDVDSIHLAVGEPMSGPNLEREASLIRFYLTIDGKMIVPMLGRISHISSEDDQNLFPVDSRHKTSDKGKLLTQFGLRPETCYYNENGLDAVVEEKDGIAEFMANRPSDAVIGLN